MMLLTSSALSPTYECHLALNNPATTAPRHGASVIRPLTPVLARPLVVFIGEGRQNTSTCVEPKKVAERRSNLRLSTLFAAQAPIPEPSTRLPIQPSESLEVRRRNNSPFRPAETRRPKK